MGFRRRVALLLMGLAAALFAVWVRAFQLQVVSSDVWRAKASEARSQDRDVEPARGRILDADGIPLAYDRSILRLVFNPEEWTTRSRWRCQACRAIHFRRLAAWTKSPAGGAQKPPSAPTSCSCGAKPAIFDPVAEEDLFPLEEAIGVPHGALVAYADAQMEETDLRVEEALGDAACGDVSRAERARRAKRPLPVAIEEDREAVLGMDAFRREDLRVLFRQDWYRRDVLVSEVDLGQGRAMPVKRLDDAAVRLVELDVAGRYRGFRAVPASERWYPRHGLGAALLGFASPASAEEVRASPKDENGAAEVSPATRVGRSGLEALYDAALRGRRGRLRIERDEDGNLTVRTVSRAAVPGGDLRLHARVEAMTAAANALEFALPADGYALDGPGSGGFVVMDAETGAILAWADAPTFDLDGDPRRVTRVIAEDDAADAALRAKEAAGDVPEDFRATPAVSLSRVARIAVEPGSSLKLLAALTMLEEGEGLSDSYHCAGEREQFPHDRPRCSHDHPDVGLEGAIEVSCNRYFADHASMRPRLEAHAVSFPAWAARVGLGAPTGVDLISSARGRYPSALDSGQLRMVAIGQSVTATPLHMARLACLLANGHFLPIPRLAAEAGSAPVATGGTEVALRDSTLARIRAGMKAVAYGAGGTARRMFEGIRGLEGVTVYGKTGTAQPGQAFDPEGATGKKPNHLWFVGYAEQAGASRKIAFAMVLHARRGGSGGDEAAPAVARFLGWWFGGGGK